MKIEYEPPRIEKDYGDYKGNCRKYGKYFAEKLEKMIRMIELADNAYQIRCIPYFQMHLLKGNLKGCYSLSPDNKKTKWRVVAICIDENGNCVSPKENEISFLIGIKTFRLREVGDYHD